MAYLEPTDILALARWHHYGEIPSEERQRRLYRADVFPVLAHWLDIESPKVVGLAFVSERYATMIAKPTLLSDVSKRLTKSSDVRPPTHAFHGTRPLEIEQQLVLHDEAGDERFGVLDAAELIAGSGSDVPSALLHIVWDEKPLPYPFGDTSPAPVRVVTRRASEGE
ncbi:hypothetical protein ACVU7I_03200 [Patulibacter sp. S7RM1-6]